MEVHVENGNGASVKKGNVAWMQCLCQWGAVETKRPGDESSCWPCTSPLLWVV